MNVVPLYVKTKYSLLQSSCRIEDLVVRAKSLGYQTLAITDEGNMHGVLKFYQACLKYHIKPIIGLKVYIQINNQVNSLLLYAKNNNGYRQLMKIASYYQINGVLSYEFLNENAIDILAIYPISENLRYEFPLNSYQAVFDIIKLLKAVYQDLYLGITKFEEEDEIINSNYLFEISNYVGVEPIALNPVYFIEENDWEVYQTIKAIKKGEIEQLDFIEKNAYLLRPFEYEKLFDQSLLEKTNQVAEKCDVSINFNERLLPSYPVNDASKYLQLLSEKGLVKRLGSVVPLEYQKRLYYELETIKKVGFSDYFLIVWDFILYAKKQGIYVGPGRGSAPASLVSYSLGITEIDPLKYGLLFERFLNQERITMPDIDVDFPDDGRDEVIKYVGSKYGIERVAHICTFNTFASKLSIRDVARVYQLTDERLQEILKHIDNKKNTLKEQINENSRLRELMLKYDDINRVLKLASRIEGLPKSTSTHAAGIIITKDDLVNYTPLDKGINGLYQTQYEASDLEALGLLKIDFLGLKNLTNIYKTIIAIQADFPNFGMPTTFDDAKTFNMLASGDTFGVFQLESMGMRKLLMALKVDNFNDIIQVLALYRPGPMSIIPEFIARKQGRTEIKYPHPDLSSILKDTYGTILYQDQILLIAWKFAGYTLNQADLLRRAISKKNRDILEKERKTFVQSSIGKGYDIKTAEEIYDYIVDFADYGFNKAHSVAYASIAYQTAFLKANFAAYYLAVLMNNVLGSDSSIKEYLKEAQKMKIKVLPPNINISMNYFVVLNNEIVFPLSSIKGLDQMKVANIIKERDKGYFKSYDDYITRVNKFLNLSLFENIIYSSALDIFGLTKKAMIENLSSIINRNQYSFVTDLIKTSFTKSEFNYGTLLAEEKRVLGQNINYNFFYQYLPLYQNNQYKKINQLQIKKTEQVLGIVKSIKEITTKRGDKMAYILLDDDSAEIDLVLFPEVYHQFYPFVHNQILMVKGEVVDNKGKINFIVEKIIKK